MNERVSYTCNKTNEYDVRPSVIGFYEMGKEGGALSCEVSSHKVMGAHISIHEDVNGSLVFYDDMHADSDWLSTLGIVSGNQFKPNVPRSTLPDSTFGKRYKYSLDSIKCCKGEPVRCSAYEATSFTDNLIDEGTSSTFRCDDTADKITGFKFEQHKKGTNEFVHFNVVPGTFGLDNTSRTSWTFDGKFEKGSLFSDYFPGSAKSYRIRDMTCQKCDTLNSSGNIDRCNFYTPVSLDATWKDEGTSSKYVCDDPDKDSIVSVRLVENKSGTFDITEHLITPGNYGLQHNNSSWSFPGIFGAYPLFPDSFPASKKSYQVKSMTCKKCVGYDTEGNTCSYRPEILDTDWYDEGESQTYSCDKEGDTIEKISFTSNQKGTANSAYYDITPGNYYLEKGATSWSFPGYSGGDSLFADQFPYKQKSFQVTDMKCNRCSNDPTDMKDDKNDEENDDTGDINCNQVTPTNLDTDWYDEGTPMTYSCDEGYVIDLLKFVENRSGTPDVREFIVRPGTYGLGEGTDSWEFSGSFGEGSFPDAFPGKAKSYRVSEMKCVSKKCYDSRSPFTTFLIRSGIDTNSPWFWVVVVLIVLSIFGIVIKIARLVFSVVG